MKVPHGFLPSLISVSRRVATGTGYQDTTVGTYRARVEVNTRINQTQQGPLMLNVHTLYLRPESDVQVGDRIGVPSGAIVEVRECSPVEGPGGPAYRKAVAW